MKEDVMENKTIKNIADELGISKQRVYRFIKSNRISEVHQRNGVMYYDDVAETRIKSHFYKNGCIGEVYQNHISDTVDDTVKEVLISMLKTELDMKNKQIDELNARLAETTEALTTAQALHAGTIKQIGVDSEVVKEKRNFFGFFKK
jgi:predicted transcriptional regulator